MSGFLYYIPKGHSGLTLADLAAVGLGYAFDRGPAKTQVLKGPDDRAGVIVADEQRLRREIRYISDQQTWRQLQSAKPRAESGPCAPDPPLSALGSPLSPWVGLYRGDLPGPEDLARKDQLKGHWVRLADEREWLCPIARGWTDEDGELRWYHNLPQVLELDDVGEWRSGSVLAKYAPLWDLAERWDETLQHAWFKDDEGESGEQEDESGEKKLALHLTFQGAVDAAVVSLAANYRIGRVEAAMLGILTREIAADVLNALVDLPARREWAQKKMTDAGPAGGSIVDGPPDAILPTGQP